LGDQAGGLLRRLRRDGHERIVVVCAHIDDGALVRARELGVGRVVRRCDATPERLSAAVVAAAHDGTRVAPDHFGRLLDQVNRTGQRSVDPHAFSAREVEVLRLLAEGYDTADIADALAYSERTIKNVIHAVTSRLQLRNRSHAVAVAMRTGVI
jgi:DNA-binding NarL/FixJ family response regulator